MRIAILILMGVMLAQQAQACRTRRGCQCHIPRSIITSSAQQPRIVSVPSNVAQTNLFVIYPPGYAASGSTLAGYGRGGYQSASAAFASSRSSDLSLAKDLSVAANNTATTALSVFEAARQDKAQFEARNLEMHMLTERERIRAEAFRHAFPNRVKQPAAFNISVSSDGRVTMQKDGENPQRIDKNQQYQTQADEYQDLQLIVETKCAKCHNGDLAEADFNMQIEFPFDLKRMQQIESRISHQDLDKRMPKNGDSLEGREKIPVYRRLDDLLSEEPVR